MYWNIMANIRGDYGKQRRLLKDIIPLNTPFAVYISPSHRCNFRCFYCLQSKAEEEKKKLGIFPDMMNVELAEKIAEQLSGFDFKLKRVMFSGCGEPLVNKDFAKIVRCFVDKDISEKYELNTNGLLLNRKMIDDILEAGITNIRISIQGLTSKKYKEISGVDIDYETMLNNFKYLYSKAKGRCKVYCKIIDACFDKGETDEDFYRMYNDVCDDMYVEHLIQAQPHMEDIYNSNDVDTSVSLHKNENIKKQVCPLMFYQLQVDACGNIFPCCIVGLPPEFALGNVKDNKLTDVWKSEKIKRLYLDNLRKNMEKYTVCAECEAYSAISQAEDMLDGYEKEVASRVELMK